MHIFRGNQFEVELTMIDVDVHCTSVIVFSSLTAFTSIFFLNVNKSDSLACWIKELFGEFNQLN